MKPLVKLSALSALMFIAKSHAFNVDKMFVISDDKGNGIITLTNNQERPLFINSNIEEIDIDGTEIVKKTYNRENVDSWKISLTNSKFVLNPGESKDIGIRSLCHNTSCDTTQDLTFLIPFAPSTYTEGGYQTSGIEVNYGYSPVFVIPTSSPKVDYEIENRGSQLWVDNNSNTLINVYVDACSESNDKFCKQRYTLVANREKVFELPKTMQASKLAVTVSTHDRESQRRFVLDREL
ncbi:hypothetical protein AB0535_004500 [Vibrio parahaemolyticus]|nr:hypothetical protein [Vibrio parahaemolyticus]